MEAKIVVEYLKHIRTLHVYAEVDPIPEQILGALKESFDVNSKSKRLTLGGASVFSFQNVNLKASAPSSPFNSTYTSAQLGNVSSLNCSSCSAELVHAVGLKFKDLPSTYWMDLVDCWSCHRSEFAGVTNNLSQQSASDLILPGPGSAHIGLDFILLHKENVGDVSTKCSLCGEMIGQPIGSSHLKLLKHAIAIQIENGSRIAPPSPLQLLFSRLHEAMESNAVQNFTIHQDSTTECVNISVLNWTMLSMTEDLSQICPAVKIAVHTEGYGDDLAFAVDQKCFLSLESAIQNSWPTISHNGMKIALIRVG